MSVRLHLVLILLSSLTAAQPQEEEDVRVEVIVDSSPCSTTCGLGMQTQRLCVLKNTTAAMEENNMITGGPEVSEECHSRRVKCVASWQCGLTSMTVMSGDRVELDCLGDVMKAMGKFSWRVSWRRTPGLISSDNTLFARWKAPLLDRVILDPVSEKDAGTYRCDVQDLTFHRMKRIYWGVRVLPSGVLDLDYEHSLTHLETAETEQNQNNYTLSVHGTAQVVLGFIGASVLLILFVVVYRVVKRRQLRLCDGMCPSKLQNHLP